MPTLVTGGTGFVGSHLVRLLVSQGESVRVLVRPGRPCASLEGLPVEIVHGDLRESETVTNAVRGCDTVFHMAADYRLWALNPSELYINNIGGTGAVLKAAAELGVKRVVYTSTVGCMGYRDDGVPGSEETPVAFEEMVGHYKRSKFIAEQVALRYAQLGLPVVIVNPSTPIGSWDWKPTPTGKIIVDFLNGRMPAFLDTGLNLVDVEDVARGHLLAAEKGKPGEKYILGNQDLTLKDILKTLARISGRKAPGIRIPYWMALMAARIEEYRARLMNAAPSFPLEGVRMARKKMFFSSEKAIRELGFPQTPVENALERAAFWYSEHGYVRC